MNLVLMDEAAEHDAPRSNSTSGTPAMTPKIVELDKKLFTLYQGNNQSLDLYLCTHVDLCKAIKDHGGTPGYSLLAARIVAKEQGLDFDSASQEKRFEVMEDAAKR